MKLNSKKVKREMERLGLTYQEVADKAKLNSRQIVFYYLKAQSFKSAEMFAKILNYDPKDLIE